MTESEIHLEGVPALLYIALWQTREMGVLKPLMERQKIQSLKIAILFEDYKPGGLISLDGIKGDYTVETIDSLEGIDYDGAIIGKLRPVVKLLEGHLLSKGFWLIISRKVKLKGRLKLLKFGKLLLRCAL